MVINKTVSLIDNWDVVPTIKDGLNKSPIIENRGIEALREFINRKNIGSFLLSGQRGSGKTTSITHLFQEIDKESCLIIFLDAIYLEAVENDHQNEDKLLQILRQLIRSLAKELEDRNYKIPKELTELMSDLKSTEIERLQKQSILIGQKALLGAGTRLFGDVLNSNLSVYEQSKSSSSKLNKTVGFTIEGLTDDFSKIVSYMESGKLKKSFCKKFLELIKISKIKEKKSINKIVFVIDELDAYDSNPKSVLDIIKKFKNLFTLSKAQFIFIVGEVTYNTVLTDDTFRTLFTEKYFLPKPNGDDLSKFLDGILYSKKEIDLEWEQLKWYVISLSHHNFYQLMQEIRSYTNYDRKLNKTRINIGKLSFIESIRSSVHYALNIIYKYHLNDRAYCHHDNTLFNELSLIEESLLNWVLNKENNPVSLKLSLGDSSNNMEVESNIRTAKIAFVRYLHLLADVPIADDFGDKLEDQIMIDWNSLLVGLSNFKTVMKGVKGPITPTENELIRNKENIISKLLPIIEMYGDNVENKNFSNIVKSSMEHISFLYPDEYLLSIDKTIEQIENKLLYQRNSEDTKNSLELTKNLSLILENYFSIQPSSYVLKKDWGNIQPIEVTNEIILGDDSSHGNKLLSRMTIYSPKVIDSKPIEIEYKVKIKPNSLINFLINTKNNSSETDDEFYMVRIDTRKASTTYSILLKPEGNPNWNTVTNAPLATVSKIKPDKWINVKVAISNNKIELYQKNNIKFSKSLECKFDGKIENLGFGNELGEVSIKDISLKNIITK